VLGAALCALGELGVDGDSRHASAQNLQTQENDG
jgi:hypothetical protein